jgi:hypothetical protein
MRDALRVRSKKPILIMLILVGLLCLLGDDPVRMADKSLLDPVPATEAGSRQVRKAEANSSSIRLTVTVAAAGVTVRLYDESGVLVQTTQVLTPPAVASLTTPDGSLVELSIPGGVFPGAAIVDIYMEGRPSVRPLIEQADAKIAEKSAIPFGTLGPLEFTANAEPQGMVSISLSYPEGSSTALLNSLKAYVLDIESRSWIPVRNSRVDPGARIVTFDVARLGVFRLMAGSAPNLNGVIVYPNPFRPREAKDNALKFIGLTDNVDIRIYTLSGDLVWGRHFEYTGGGATWNGRNSQGKEVASGLYVYQVTNGSGEKFTGRVSVIW